MSQVGTEAVVHPQFWMTPRRASPPPSPLDMPPFSSSLYVEECLPPHVPLQDGGAACGWARCRLRLSPNGRSLLLLLLLPSPLVLPLPLRTLMPPLDRSI